MDTYRECIKSALGFVDELVIVMGDRPDNDWPMELSDERIKFVSRSWPKEFGWPFIGQSFQLGYESCSGDWVVHLDADFILHENEYDNIRKTLRENSNQAALSFWKYQFILPDRYNLKSRLVIAVNRGLYGDRIRFDSGGDLCQPSLDGQELKPSDVQEARVAFWNYEKLLKTEEQIREDVGRMARAWRQHFGEYRLGGPDDESAYEEWLYMVKGRFSKPQQHVRLEEHPKVMQATIAKLLPEQWGYSGFGRLGENDYIKK
jgi:glycosyltransferase involved in cell wall biosynthesis